MTLSSWIAPHFVVLSKFDSTLFVYSRSFLYIGLYSSYTDTELSLNSLTQDHFVIMIGTSDITLLAASYYLLIFCHGYLSYHQQAHLLSFFSPPTPPGGDTKTEFPIPGETKDLTRSAQFNASKLLLLLRRIWLFYLLGNADRGPSLKSLD